MGIVIKKEKLNDNVLILTEAPYDFIKSYNSSCQSITFNGDIVNVNTLDSNITFDVNDVSEIWVEDLLQQSFTGTAQDLAEILTQRFFTVEKRVANQILHEQITNPSDYEVSLFKRLSFTCDGAITVNVGINNIVYPYTAGGVTVLGADIECDSENVQVITFNGTGTLTYIAVS